MYTLDPSTSAFWVTVGMSCLCGGIIGTERQMRGKPAGIRTSMLICLGTTFFVLLGRTHDSSSVDATRVLGQIVTGIGFLGGGVILARGGVVTGVTTAAVIWVLASVGAMIGFGHELAALAVSVVVVGIVTGVEFCEGHFKALRRGVHQWIDRP